MRMEHFKRTGEKSIMSLPKVVVLKSTGIGLEVLHAFTNSKKLRMIVLKSFHGIHDKAGTFLCFEIDLYLFNLDRKSLS